MCRILFPVAVAAMLGAASVAAAKSTSGTVMDIDMDARTITLQNGETFALPAGFENPGIEPGAEVVVTREMKDGRHEASEVTITK